MAKKTVEELQVELTNAKSVAKKAFDAFVEDSTNADVLSLLRKSLREMYSIRKKLTPALDFENIEKINFDKMLFGNTSSITEKVKSLINTELYKDIPDISEKDYLTATGDRFVCVVVNDDNVSRTNYIVSISLYVLSKKAGLLKKFNILNTNDKNVSLLKVEPRGNVLVTSVALNKPNGEKYFKRFYLDMATANKKESDWCKI